MSLRSVRVAAAAALLGLLLTGTAPAQVYPNSSQNVVPRSTANPVALEAQRRELFAQMLRDPANLDTAFAYAALSAQLGDLESAISTLERMLIFAPGLPRLQFELGVLYYRLGALETASTYFRAVDAAPDVPAEIRSQVTSYLAAAQERNSGQQSGGSIVIGGRYQTNANAGPANSTINLNGFDFTLSPGALGQPDANGFVRGTLNGAVDLESQGDTFVYSLTGYGALYAGQSQLNTGLVQAKAGPSFNLKRFDIDNATASAYGILAGAVLGGAPYLGAIGIGGDVRIGLDARTRLTLRNELTYENYLDSTLRPTASLRSGPHASGSAELQYQLSSQLGLVLGAGIDRRIGHTGFASSWQIAGQAGIVVSMSSPIESLDGPWRASLTAGASYLAADAPDPIFSTVNAEQTAQVTVLGKLTVPLASGFFAEGTASYTRSISNYALSHYDNAAVSLGIGKAF